MLEIARRRIAGVWRTGYEEENGGSQPGAARVIGPYTITFADFPGPDARGVTVDLVTLPVGTIVADWWADPVTYEDWLSPNGGDAWLGQGTGWTVNNDPPGQKGTWGEVGLVGTAAADLGDASTEAAAGDHTFLADPGVAMVVPFNKTVDASPIQAMWWNFIDVDAPTAGSVDVYFLIALAPTAPATIT